MTGPNPIIAGDEWKELLRCADAKQWCHRAATQRRRYRSLLAQWEVDAVCRFVPLPDTNAVRMHFHGTPVSRHAYRDSNGRVAAAAVRELLESGASLNIARMERYSNALLHLSRDLEVALRCPIQINLYQTPASGQGLGSHVDRHDVLVLQLRGEKRWQLSAPGSLEPLAVPTAGEQCPAEPIVTLRAGDWLYVPRGIRHEVRNCGSDPSLHLTIGFHPLTAGTILSHALEQARAESRLLNQALSVEPDGIAAQTPDDWLRVLRGFVDLEAEVDRHRRAFRALGVPVPAADVPDRAALDAADADSRFAWRTGAVSLSRTATALQMDLPYRREPLQLYPELVSHIEHMSELALFRPRDLDLDLETATLLACLLAGSGFLTLTENQ